MNAGRRVGVSRALLGLLACAFLVAGLLGLSSYWEAYYQHRGFVTLSRLPRAGAGRLLSVNFYSPSLGRSADYLAYLPAGYEPARRYPVFYVLHGMPGRPQVFIDIANLDVRLDNRLSQRQVPPMILVFPDGRIGGSALSDSEWANTPSGRFESYVLDVVHDVDRRFATIRDRQARVIAGFSAGGYGAINIALHHLAVFGSVESWSGYFSQTRSGVFAHATRADLAYNSPIEYVRTLSPRLAVLPLRVYMFVGRGDSASRHIVAMDTGLSSSGADASYAIYKGGHDWQLWYVHLNQMLILAGQDVLAPLSRSPLPAHRLSPPPRAHRRVAAAHRRVRHPQRRLGRARRRARAAHRRPRRARRHVRAAHRHPRPARRADHRPVHRGPRAVLAAGGITVGGGAGGLIGGLLLALLSAAAINLGFLLQHRGLSATRSLAGGHWAVARAMLRSPSWLGGQALGWAGFAAQIVAVSIAPLSLVQSFAAGGLALSVPLAAGLFGHRISRRERLAVLVVAAALAALPIGLAGSGENLEAGRLAVSTIVVFAVALPIGLTRRPPLQAVAAGLLYGIADAAIKAVSVSSGAIGASALLSGWTVVAVLATFAGFLAFQAALRGGSAVTGITLMNCLAALIALACGVIAFGESIGGSPSMVIAHVLAIALVLCCVPVLAAAQTEIAETLEPPRERAAQGEHQTLEPWTDARAPGPHHVAQPQVARQRVGSLRGEQQQDGAERSRQHSSPAARHPDERKAGHHARG